MNRPIPVVLSAILLGILAFFTLILAVVMLIPGIAMLHHGVPQMPTTATPFPPSFMPAMMIGFSVFYVAAAVWFILTLIGLVRLRSWARYSVLVISGLIAAFGAVCTIASFAIHPILRNSASVAPGADPKVMGAISFFIGAFYLIVTAIAVAHLVYFNRAHIRAVFQQADPALPGPPNTSTGRYRPTAITIISWFLMVCAPFSLLYAFFPIPAFFFGFTLYGIAARAIYLGYAVIGFSIGYGLYRLRRAAPIALVAWLVIGLIHMLAILTPWGRRNVAAYMNNVTPHGAVTLNPFASTGFVAVCFILGLAFNGFIFWLLYRHRAAFTPAPPAPPMPPSQFIDAPIAG